MRRSALMLLACTSVIMTLYGLSPRPELKSFTTYSTAVFDSKGRLMRLTLSEDDRYRLYTPLDQISPDFIAATLLYEDQHYYEHSGVDYLALVRAFWTTYILNQRRVGASTIAMQVARLRWSIPSHTLSGKLQQIIKAIQLSRHYTKEEILEVYLNLAPYGRNIEGIAAASLIYFNKKPNELSLPEALTLAVIPQNPNKRNPTTKQGFKRLLLARENVFKRWIEQKPEDKSQQTYFELPLKVRSPDDLPFLAPHFVNYIMKNRGRWEHGAVNTTLDLTQQKRLEGIVKNYISTKSGSGIKNAAVLLVNYETMEVKSMVGSADFYDNTLQGQVNGVLAKRSPGSTLKPFVYALAIDEGLIHPMSLMKDSPRRFGGFTPENFDKQFMGPISVKDALVSSRNVPAVTLQSQLKKQSFYGFLKSAGITGLKDASHYGLALALGGGEVTMWELVSLYSMLANNGLLKPIKSVKTQKNRQSTAEKRMLSAEASFLVLDMLKDNAAPDALDVDTGNTLKNHIAWKTGTSWAFRDAWAIGVSGPYAIAVWVGNFNGKGNEAFIGRSAAGPLLFSLFDAVLPDTGWKVDDLLPLEPLNIKKLQVCKNTGDLFEKHCPTAVESWFIPGVSPIKVSNIYRTIPIEIATGLRACWHEAGKTEMKTYEFWPSDFLQIFNQAGLSLRTPPRYAHGCSLDQRSSSGQVPVITSPQSTIEYVIQSDVKAENRIPFSAIVDPDVETIFWFVNGKYEGRSKSSVPYFWQASNGQYQVRAIDDSGRGASKTIRVIQAQ